MDATYEAPTRIDDAVRLLQAGGHVLAGGTDLLVQMRTGRAHPAAIVDVKRIPECTVLRLGADTLEIGAALSTAALREHAELGSLFPGLLEAAELIGSEQIQGRSTLGGNLCNGSPAADSVPALVALDARCRIHGPDGERSVPVEQFVTGPGQTVLQAGELLVAFEIARPAPRSADAYLRLIPRTEMDIAVVGAGAQVALDANGRCTTARVAIGAVAPTVRRVAAAERALVGQAIDAAVLATVAEAASDAADPIDDTRGTVAYRRRVAGVLARRAVARAAERAATRGDA